MPVDLTLLERLLAESEQRAQDALGSEDVGYETPPTPYTQPGEPLPVFEAAQTEKQRRTGWTPFVGLLDTLGAVGYGTTGFVQGLIGAAKGETDISTAFIQMGQGLMVPFTQNPAHRFAMSDTLKQLGWEPESASGRFARGALGLALDIVTDPTTYAGFGVSRHALKIGGATLGKKAARMAGRLRDHLATMAKLGGEELDEVAANARLQQFLMPWVSGPKGMRSTDDAKLILSAFGKKESDVAIQDLMENGLAKYMDRGGLKWMNRTIVKSATADVAGVAFDNALGKYLVDPIVRTARKTGEIAMKAAPVRAAVEVGRSVKNTLSDLLGPAFLSGYWMKTPAGRASVRLFERERAYKMQAVREAVEDLRHIADPTTGKVRTMTDKEALKLHEVMHDADLYSNKGFEGYDPYHAQQLIDSLPPELKEKQARIRGMLDEILPVERDIHGFEMGERANYWTQYWKQDSTYNTKEALKTGKLKPEEFDFFLKSRMVMKPWKDAVKLGLETDPFKVLETRLGASASLTTTQDFLQRMTNEYGMRFVRHGDKVLRKMGPDGVVLADMVKDFEGRTMTLEGQAFTQAGKLGQAIDLAREGQREAALDMLRKSKPEMPEKEIDKAIDAVRKEFETDLKGARYLYRDMQMWDPYAKDLSHEIAGIEQHIAELETVGLKLKTRSMERLLSSAIRHPPALPGVAWKGHVGILKEARHTMLRTREAVLGGRIAQIEGRISEGTATEADKVLLAQSKRDLGTVAYALEGTPDYERTRAGFRTLYRGELSRHQKELEAIGYTAEESAAHVRDLQAFGTTVLTTTQAYSQASKNWRRWASGGITSSDPLGRELALKDLAAMEGVSRQAGELEGALAGQEKAFLSRLKEVEAATEVNGLSSIEEAKDLYLTWKDLSVRHEGLSRLRRSMATPEEIRESRRLLADPHVAERALENANPVTSTISPRTGEVIHVPAHPVQVAALKRTFQQAGIGKYAPELLERVTGAKTWEDLSFEGAQEMLEIARRRPATLREAKLAGALEAIPDGLVKVPDFQSMRVKLDGDWVSTKEVFVPENVAKAIQAATTHWRPGPAVGLMLGWYDRLQDLFKWSVTLPWPGYHARNTLENQMKAMLEVGVGSMVNPRYIDEYLHTLFGSTKSVKTAIGEIPREAIREAMSKRLLWRSMPTGLGELGTPGKMVGEVADALSGVFRNTPQADAVKSLNAYRLGDILQKAPFNIPGKFLKGSANLENATIHTFILARLDAGHTLEAALDAAEDVFFTYGVHLTEFERNFMRRVLPFYSWMRAAIPYTGHVIKEHPVLLSSLADIGQFGGNEDEFSPYVPQYIKESLKLKLPGAKGETPRFVVLNNLMTVDWSREFVTQDANAFMRSILGSMSPIITMPFEFALKKDFFFGGDIQDRQRINAVFDDSIIGKSLKAWLNAREVRVGKKDFLAVDGQRLWATRSFIFGRLYNSLVTLSRKDMVPQDKLLRLGMGLMSQKLDLERQRALLRERAMRMQNDFFRAVKQGDDVRAQQIYEELRGE